MNKEDTKMFLWVSSWFNEENLALDDEPEKYITF